MQAHESVAAEAIENARSNAGANSRERGAGHGAIGRFSKRVSVRDHVKTRHLGHAIATANSSVRCGRAGDGRPALWRRQWRAGRADRPCQRAGRWGRGIVCSEVDERTQVPAARNAPATTNTAASHTTSRVSTAAGGTAARAHAVAPAADLPSRAAWRTRPGGQRESATNGSRNSATDDAADRRAAYEQRRAELTSARASVPQRKCTQPPITASIAQTCDGPMLQRRGRRPCSSTRKRPCHAPHSTNSASSRRATGRRAGTRSRGSRTRGARRAGCRRAG